LHPCDQFDGVAERSTGDELQQGRQRRQLGRWRSGRDTVHERRDLGFVSARGSILLPPDGWTAAGKPDQCIQGDTAGDIRTEGKPHRRHVVPRVQPVL
jgi:hypothetical protein